MKSIQDLAREAGFDNVNGKIYTWAGQHNVTDEMRRFHDLAIAQYRESLLAGVGEPEYFYWDSTSYPSRWENCNKSYYEYTLSKQGPDEAMTAYTADQMAAAVLLERIKTLESVIELSTVGATYPELMKYLQAEIEAIRNTK